MAFNPFHRFRKHQKTLLAGVTILSMISFIVLGGYGEMSRLGDWFGKMSYWVTGRSRTPRVATMFGQNVETQEVYGAMARRQAANGYMVEAGAFGRQKALDHINEEVASWKDERQQEPVGRIVSMLSGLDIGQLRRALQVPQVRQYYAMQFYRADQDLRGAWIELTHTKKKDEAKLVQTLRNILADVFREFKRPAGELYFGGKLDGNSLVEFLLWQREADRLGIDLTREDVDHLVDQNVYNALTSGELARIRTDVRHGYRDLSNEDLRAALRDEFRVHMARAVLLGYEPDSLAGSRESVTPYRFWQFYRDNLTESRITLLPVPVDQEEFLNEVKTPADKKAFDKELRDFFKKHVGQEENPASAEAGFKQPPRIQVEWVSARRDAPHYRRQSEKILGLAEAASQVANLTKFMGGPAALAAGSSVPAWVSQEDADKWKWGLPDEPLWSDSAFLYSIKPEAGKKKSRLAPQAVAATVGELLGAAGTQGSVLPALTTHESAAAAHAVMQAEGPLVECAAVLAGSNPLAAAGLAHYLDQTEALLPPAVVKARARERTLQSVAQKLVDQNIKAFREEIETRAKLKTAEDAREFLEANRPQTVYSLTMAMAGAIGTGSPAPPALVLPVALVSQTGDADRLRLAGGLFCMGPSPLGVSALQASDEALLVSVIRQPIEQAIERKDFHHGATRKPHDRFTILDDHDARGLKPLWQAYRASSEGQLDADGHKFAHQFFDFPSSFSSPDFPPSFEPIKRYEPKTLVSRGESFLYWSTAEEPAYEPTFKEVKDKVVKRWKLEKARRFAEEEAKRVAAEARKSGEGTGVLRDVLIRHPRWGRLIELPGEGQLNGVSRLVRTPPAEMSQTSSGMQFERYPRDPKDLKVEYPSKDFVDKLLSLKTKRDAVVLHDLPQAVYYVAVLSEERFPPSMEGFRNAYVTPSDHQQLLEYLASDTKYRDEHAKAVLEGLKREARLETNQDVIDTIKPGD